MARKHAAIARNVNARRIIESVRDQTDDAKAWQRLDHVVAVHNERDARAWREQNERDKLRRELLAIAAPLLNNN